MIKVYNTITRKKEAFEPLLPPDVKMYACGITAYDICHIGHGRQAIIYDVIRRYLEYKGYVVTYVRNYTDVDDKVIASAKSLGISALQHAINMIAECEMDMAALGVRPPDISPKVSENIDCIIKFIKALINTNFAYATPNGDVYFVTRKFQGYGKLSNKNIERLHHETRAIVKGEKKDPLDFALWKSAKKDEIYWESEWGRGRPGWHIECSAISTKYLGESFDIHGGGRDLIFPHHENEIAQSEACSGKIFAKYWIHNGLITIDGQKMSKSQNNYITIKDALAKYHYEAVRLFMLMHHYSSDIDISDNYFEDAEKKLYYGYRVLFAVERVLEYPAKNNLVCGSLSNCSFTSDIINEFEAAMDDDFNTALAISGIFKAFKHINQILDCPTSTGTEDKTYILRLAVKCLSNAFHVLGIFCIKSTAFLEEMRSKYITLNVTEINGLIKERTIAKENKNYKKADEIRNILDSQGVAVRDCKSGETTWDIKCLL